MDRLLKFGRLNYAAGLAGLGLQQFFYPGIRPVFAPVDLTDVQPLVYAFSLTLLFVAVSIVCSFHARTTCLLAGAFFLIFFIFIHLPNRFSNNPGNLGFWTDAFKILSFSGGAFLIAGTFSTAQQGDQQRPSFVKFFDRFIPIGRSFLESC